MPTIHLNSLKESNGQSAKSHLEVKEGFRVRVCLERFFSDQRSRAYVNVIPHHRVEWLQQHLTSIFGLKGLFCLCSNGYLLPSEEPLSILQPNDPVEVIPLSKEFFNYANANLSRINLQSNETLNSHSIIDSMVVLICSAGEVNEEVAGFKEDQDTELLCMKQQAIALLETCCEDTASAEFDSGQAVNITGYSDKPRRTRRRVRRRKRHLSAGDSNGGTRNGETNKDNIENFAQPILENNGYTLMEEKGGVGDLVNMFEHVDKAAVKDNLADTRKARIIHSISPTQT